MNSLVTRNELAEILNVSVQTIDRERKRNDNFPPVLKIGTKLVRFSESDVMSYIDSLKEDNNTIN
jgi:predicted DNA-binding transcriptional regulator AlpA